MPSSAIAISYPSTTMELEARSTVSLRFFEEELIPYVETNHRTVDYRILSGPQAGATFGIHVLSHRPELFGAYILSNPFWISGAREKLLDDLTRSVRSEHAATSFADRFLMISHDDDESTGAIAYLDSWAEASK